MRILTLILCICSLTMSAIAQQNSKITTIDFVQVVNDNKAETKFYYQNNWKVLRQMAVKKGYIHSFQFLETPYSEEAPFHFMLITTYLDDAQYEIREEHFEELIKAKDSLKLMNDKTPGHFRKVIYGKDDVKHWE